MIRLSYEVSLVCVFRSYSKAVTSSVGYADTFPKREGGDLFRRLCATLTEGKGSDLFRRLRATLPEGESCFRRLRRHLPQGGKRRGPLLSVKLLLSPKGKVFFK